MATYYVSVQTGSDANDGSAWYKAKATFGAGIALATSPGDIVYISGGTYREYLTGIYDGTSVSPIKFIGDPDCIHFPNDLPMPVRVTIADTDEMAIEGTVNRIVDIYSETYNHFYNIWFDGISNITTPAKTHYGIYSNSLTNEFHNCAIKTGAYSARICTLYDCFAMGYIATYQCDVYNSVLLAPIYCCYGKTDFSYKVKNSILMGGNYLSYYMKSVNNTIVGSSYGERRCQSENNIYLASEFGQYENNSTYGAYNDNVLYSNCRYMGRASNDSLTSSFFDNAYTTNYESDAMSNFNQVPLWYPNWDSMKYHIKRAFDPYMVLGLSAISGNITNIETNDIMNRSRQMIDGTSKVNPGAYAASLISQYWDGQDKSQPTGFLIEKIGQKQFDVLASTGDITISALAKASSTPTPFGPILSLTDPKGIITTSFDYTTSTSFTELTVSASITAAPTWLTLTIGNIDANVNASFSAIGVY